MCLVPVVGDVTREAYLSEVSTVVEVSAVREVSEVSEVGVINRACAQVSQGRTGDGDGTLAGVLPKEEHVVAQEGGWKCVVEKEGGGWVAAEKEGGGGAVEKEMEGGGCAPLKQVQLIKSACGCVEGRACVSTGLVRRLLSLSRRYA